MMAWALFCHDFDLSKGINILSEKCPVVLDHYNLSIHSIRLGDILTHRSNLQKQIVAHVDHKYLLLVDDEGRISRIRKAKAVTRYCRRSCDMHTPINVRKALLRAVDALSNDNRLLTLLGLRVGSEMYLDQIECNAV